MNVLILSNGAPNYYHFFNHLSRLLQNDGAVVSFAVDSELSKDSNNLDALQSKVFEFSSYFRDHDLNPELLLKYNKYNLNAMLLSDFERAEVYKIWGVKDKAYLSRLLSALISFYEFIFQTTNTDYVLYENVSNTFSHVAWAVAKENNIQYIGVGGSRIPGRFSLSSDPLNDNRTKKFFKLIRDNLIIVPDEISQWATNYLDNIETVVPDYMKINGLDKVDISKRYLNKEKYKTIRRVISHIKDDEYHSFQSGNPVKTYLNLFLRNVGRKINTLKLRNYYDASNLGKDRFLLYPMHFHPESSTSILSGTYLNEYEVIKNIAFNLPQGYKLYVKDHVSAWGYPSIKFYNDLKKLPNVNILGPNENTKKLIKYSAGVITLTSTVGYEALLLGRKVFLFGRVFYEDHKNVIKIDNPHNLFNIMNDALIDEHITIDRDYALDFVAACYLATYPGSLNLMLTGQAAMAKAEEIYNRVIKPIVFSNIDAIDNENIWL
ncbi:hypothetical protein SB719_01080 [Pantoea sp. SIMBA_079]|uniref:capsular polysaccharide export protein, LipB/KpsS family n=1 Tax=Pantoea sp. SIMBA_079 TaxID=3085817 RepID=UPI0039934869